MPNQPSVGTKKALNMPDEPRSFWLKLISHPLSIGIVGALLGILGSWLIAILQAKFNSSLEIDKQRNAALIDMMSLHIEANVPQPLLDTQSSMRQILFYTLASRNAIHASAELTRQHSGCTNDMSEACREKMIKTVEILRNELGRDKTNHQDIVDALQEPFDQMENALDEAQDEGLVTFSNTKNSNIKFSTSHTGEDLFKNIGDEISDVVTDAFAKRFPGYRYSISVSDTTFIVQNAPAECMAMVGVSARSLGIKTVRVPADRFFSLRKMNTTSPSDDDKRACIRSAVRGAVGSMMSISPDELAEKSANSL